MAVGQRAIAKSLNVSVATVNRALKNDPATSAFTRARVAEAALRAGYRAEAAGAMAKGRQVRQGNQLVSVGVFFRGSVDPKSIHKAVDLRIFRGLSMAARDVRASLHVEYLAPDDFDHLEEPTHWPPVLREAFVSGAVLIGDVRPEVSDCLAAHMPCVQVRWPSRPLKADVVSEDHLGAMTLLVEHLRKLGHQQFGMADFGYHWSSAMLRFAGYVRALGELGIPYNPTNAQYLPPHAPTGHERAARVAEHIQARLKDGVRAWICLDDYQGYLLAQALRDRGIRVPQDVSLCGFDNFDPPSADLPKLTSIDGPFEAIGATAVRRVMKRLVERNSPPMHVMLGCRLIEGQSTGPVG